MCNYVISIAVAELKLTKMYDPFWLRKIVPDSNTHTRVNIECSVDRYRKLKIHVSVLVLYS